MRTSSILAIGISLGLVACGSTPPPSNYVYETNKAYPFGQANPDAPPQVKDFAPLIGISDCQSFSRKPDGTWNEAVAMEWRFKYIMNGMAVQDETLKQDGLHSGSIRQFDEKSGNWMVHYYASSAPGVKSLPAWEGSLQDDGKIVLFKEQTATNGMAGFYRLTFYDISAQSFKWIGEWVNEDQTIEYPTWKIECNKRSS